MAGRRGTGLFYRYGRHAVELRGLLCGETTQEERAEILAFCIEHNKDYGLTVETYNVSYQQIYACLLYTSHINDGGFLYHCCKLVFFRQQSGNNLQLHPAQKRKNDLMGDGIHFATQKRVSIRKLLQSRLPADHTKYPTGIANRDACFYSPRQGG